MGIANGKHDRQLRALSVGDELLVAVQHPVSILPHRARAQIAGFRACLRFGQTKAADRRTSSHVRQKGALLLNTAEVEDRSARH